MSNVLKTLVNKKLKKYGDQLNIVFYGSDKDFNREIFEKSSNFYYVVDEYQYELNNVVNTDIDKIFSNKFESYDLVITCDPYNNIEEKQKLAKSLRCPILCLHHNVPNLSTQELIKSSYKQCLNYNVATHAAIKLGCLISNMDTISINLDEYLNELFYKRYCKQ